MYSIKRLDADLKKEILNDVAEFRACGDKISILHVGRLCIRYDIPFKTMCEQVLEPDVLPTGTYDLIMAAGWRGRIRVILSDAEELEQRRQAKR